ncbi:polysaccharide deacetylase family protein [Paenibacillus sp. NEAU-GSW1]|uniref:polysaccharide deacetylase family protein n=1 Tax=Paenibacillus sp. NEAU-GSW1 TaxID=2682486 RepID=UPI0012E3287A|nr:polysaccharide deacetylase family protein [Paenibacillus sp. NEAU-GSW1]MUT67243.1 polysaccharide deacetylase family protein [Paenibacillus sp. NEAU-GSW1]
MENLLLWALYFLSFYAFLPAFISRTFGFRVFKKGRVEREIALTFDDGPDPEYTPKLLDLLAKYNAKATFFVVGSHAESQSELLRRMQEDGHIIGIHNYVHKSNWFMRPKTVRKQIEQTCDVIREATGVRSNYYRPPWGIVNVFDFARLGHYQIVLWSAIFGDWNAKLGAKKLQARMMKKLRPGEVVLLHDCGRTPGADVDAPANMLIALEAYLQEGVKRGYSFVGIDTLVKLTEEAKSQKQSWMKKSLIFLWLQYEKAFHLVFRLKQVGESNPAFHYRITTYGGQTVQLKDAARLVKGDKIVELHFDNRMLSSLAAASKSPLATGIKMLREVEHALPVLAESVKAEPQFSEVRAVYGVTMIHRGADRLGFQTMKLPDGWFARSTRIYLRVLMRVLTKKQTNVRAKERRVSIDPHMLLMPVERLMGYASKSTAIVQEDTIRMTDAVHRTLQTTADDTAPMGGNTTTAI